MTRFNKWKKNGPCRRGAATVELAVCLPLLVLITFGSLEASNMFFLRQALVQSAYETAKEAAKRDGSKDLAMQRGAETLSFRKIKDETITFDPENIDEIASGTPITVTVTVPANSNATLSFGPFKDRSISAQATMAKE